MDTTKSHLDNTRTRQAKTQSIQSLQFKPSVIEIFDDLSFFSEQQFIKTKKACVETLKTCK